MSFTLFSTSEADSQTVRIVAALAGVNVTITDVKTVHDKSATGKGPVLSTASGNVAGLGAVLRFIARAAPTAGLYGGSVFENAAVDQWVDHATANLAPEASAWLAPILKQKPTEPEVYKNAKAGVNAALRGLNNHLNTNTFLVGQQITIADVANFVGSVDLIKRVLAGPTLRPLGNFVRWFNTIAHDPVVAGVVGAIEFCAKEEFAPKPEKKEAPAPKKEEKKAEKKAAKPANDDGDDEEDKPKEKKVNPLQLLPESKMVLDATKKSFFSQQPFNPDFFTEFWNNYDPAGYTIFTCHYKYDEENTQFWLTQNLLGGFLQRLDETRKWAFGNMFLAGASEEQGPWAFQGIWLFRGPGVPFEVTDCSQSEQFDWTPVDVSTPEGKAKVEQYFIGTTVNGRNVLERRYFK